jgi:hypothetical protein
MHAHVDLVSVPFHALLDDAACRLVLKSNLTIIIIIWPVASRSATITNKNKVTLANILVVLQTVSRRRSSVFVFGSTLRCAQSSVKHFRDKPK